MIYTYWFEIYVKDIFYELQKLTNTNFQKKNLYCLKDLIIG